MRKGSARERCGKYSYTSHGLAERSAHRAERREGCEIRVYWHAECGSWHLSSESLSEYANKRSTQ